MNRYQQGRMAPGEDRLYTPAELAELLQIPVRTLAMFRYRGRGPRYVKVSHKAIRYRASDVAAWLEARARIQSGTN